MNKRQIYVVFYYDEWTMGTGRNYFRGVFSTKKAAQAWIDTQDVLGSYMNIVPMTLDVPLDRHGMIEA